MNYLETIAREQLAKARKLMADAKWYADTASKFIGENRRKILTHVYDCIAEAKLCYAAAKRIMADNAIKATHHYGHVLGTPGFYGVVCIAGDAACWLVKT